MFLAVHASALCAIDASKVDWKDTKLQFKHSFLSPQHSGSSPPTWEGELSQVRVKQEWSAYPSVVLFAYCCHGNQDWEGRKKGNKHKEGCSEAELKYGINNR